MKREEMRKTINDELRKYLPVSLKPKDQKMWKSYFNAMRMHDLAQATPKGAEIISNECLQLLKQNSREIF